MNGQIEEKVIVLLGAGASAEAGACTSEEITKILVDYGSYCPSEGSTQIENLLRYVQVRIADHLQIRASQVNFEFLLGTLMELATKSTSPVVPFLGEGDLVVEKVERVISLPNVIRKLYALLRELLCIRNPVDYLNPLSQLLDLSKPLDLFTLNYDLSLETALSNLRIAFTTGYRKRDKGLPVWDPSEFDKQLFDARIFKLHGSINWGEFFTYPPPPANAGATRDSHQAAESYLANYPERVAFDPYPIGLVEPPDRREGMVSTMNFGTRKEVLYASSQFTVLFNHFLEGLTSAGVIVMAGYSFSDERINKTIEEALVNRKGDLHVIVVNPSLFRIERNYPVLRKFMELKWGTGINKQLGAALKDGSLLAAVKKAPEVKAERSTFHRDIDVPEQRDDTQREAPNPERILQEWTNLGITFDLTYSWMRRLAPELRQLEKCADESEAARVGHLLRPILRKVRDLCCHIRWVYEEMRFDGTYGGEYLKSINISPKQADNFSLDLVRKWLPELEMAVSLVFNTYNNATDEFRLAVTDPDYGKSTGAPSNLSMAALVIRKTTSRIYELVWMLNDICKGAGYEEPFGMIAKHQAEP